METVDSGSGQQAVQETKSKGIFKNRNFILLWLGQGTSLIGDQFHLIALPWLVLLLTGDAVSLGLVLALAGIPRAVFMLLGGALTDRFSQRTVMIVSDVGRLILTTALAGLVLSGRAEMWMLYAFALAFGTLSGVFIPASTSIVPRLVRGEQLQSANAIVQGTSQLSVFLGPAIAGGVIAFFAVQGTKASVEGVGIAFAVDALTFLVSVATLWLMTFRGETSGKKSDIIGSIRDGIAYAIGDPTLRALFVIMAFINFLFAGPFLVGVPVIASSRLPEGAAAFGLLLSAYGGGNLLGIILSGVIPRPRAGILGYVLAGFVGVFGIGIILFGLTVSTVTGCAILAVLGVFNGYLGILLITLLQKVTPMHMMGRLMSLVMLAGVGLAPISQAITGFLIKYSVEGLFVAVGILFVLTALVAVLVPEVRNIGSKISEGRSSSP